MIILATITFILVAISIPANNLVNNKSKDQHNDWCSKNEECPQPYCSNEKESIKNCQPRYGCCWRT
jgi:hypothetical protein